MVDIVPNNNYGKYQNLRQKLEKLHIYAEVNWNMIERTRVLTGL